MMSTWWAWVAGPQGTTVLALCALVLGMILGYLTGIPRGRHLEAEDIEREEAMARTHPVYRQPASDQFAAIREAGRRAWQIQQERAALAAPAAPVVDELTDSAYTQDMGARMDRFLNELFRVPYSADELWSGQ